MFGTEQGLLRLLRTQPHRNVSVTCTQLLVKNTSIRSGSETTFTWAIPYSFETRHFIPLECVSNAYVWNIQYGRTCTWFERLAKPLEAWATAEPCLRSPETTDEVLEEAAIMLKSGLGSLEVTMPPETFAFWGCFHVWGGPITGPSLFTEIKPCYKRKLR